MYPKSLCTIHQELEVLFSITQTSYLKLGAQRFTLCCNPPRIYPRRKHSIPERTPMTKNSFLQRRKSTTLWEVLDSTQSHHLQIHIVHFALLKSKQPILHRMPDLVFLLTWPHYDCSKLCILRKSLNFFFYKMGTDMGYHT